MKLDEYGDVFEHGAQGADEPRQVREEVVRRGRVKEDSGAVGQVAE